MPLDVDIPENKTGYAMWDRGFWSRKKRAEDAVEMMKREAEVKDWLAAQADTRHDTDTKERDARLHGYELETLRAATPEQLTLLRERFAGEGGLQNARFGHEDRMADKTIAAQVARDLNEFAFRKGESELERRERARLAGEEIDYRYKSLADQNAQHYAGLENRLAESLIGAGARTGAAETAANARKYTADAKNMPFDPITGGKTGTPTKQMPSKKEREAAAAAAAVASLPPPEPAPPADPNSIEGRFQKIMPIIERLNIRRQPSLVDTILNPNSF